MSAFTRTSTATLRASLRSAPKQTRAFGLHHTNEHVAHANMPFTYNNRRKFATRYAGAAVTFFAVPFIAAGYQLRKSSGAV